MADSNPSTQTLDSNPQPNPPNPQPSSSTLPPPPSLSQPSQPIPTPSIPNPNPNPTPAPIPTPIPPPPSYAPPPLAAPSVGQPTPSFFPVPQFSSLPPPPLQNPMFHNPAAVQPPGATTGPASIPVPPQPMMTFQMPPGGQPPNPAMRPPFQLMPNGFAAMPGAIPQGAIPIPGLPRYPSPFPAMVRSMFPPRPLGAVGVLPRPPIPGIPGIPGVRPIMPIIRPVIVPSVTPAEKPQTTVYVGKISPTVENDFILSLLKLCGPVKSWKRAQDPSNGAPRGFGFCEFEFAEGVLRALRLLSKFNIDGQELVLNVNQATRDYLERYVEKKTENANKLKEAEAAAADKADEGVVIDEKSETSKPAVEEPKESNDSESKENDNANFGIVTDEDREADREATDKLTSMIEERLKTKPLPPPPIIAPGDAPGNSSSDVPDKSKDRDSDPDLRNDLAEEKNEDDLTSSSKQNSENDRTETSSPDRTRRNDRRSRERDRDRDLKREKDRELERYERETERERMRKERDQRRKIEEADRLYEEYLKEWEYRERDKEKQRLYEKEKEKERERKRKKEVIYEEDDEGDDSRKRWRKSVNEDRRRKRLREKEDDFLDVQREEEEKIAEAKRKEEEEEEERLKRLQEEALKSSLDHVTNGKDSVASAGESSSELKDTDMQEDYEDASSGHEVNPGTHTHTLQNGSNSNESTMASDTQHGSNGATKKLGFGLVGSGKRAALPSVFNAEDDDDALKEKKMRPLVPIDYSTEELQAVQPSASSGAAAQPNLVAAAEFAKRLSSSGSSKEDKGDSEKERSKHRSRHETKEKSHGTENKKLLDAKQLIDMIPKTKEELFSYQINWAIYDEHALHDRMRPWISKKITGFLGEEEPTLVDYIVSSTQEHVEADHMLQLLQSILDEEAEMFVLKMWRMLIFEIKKVETGLTPRTQTR